MRMLGLEKLVTHLRSSQNWELLLAVTCWPELALDKGLNNRIRSLLSDSTNGIRRTAARALARIDDAEGIKHLTYNALSRHPVLGFDQTGYESWQEAKSLLVRYADKLDEECASLLLDDAIDPNGNLHLDTLALLPLDIVKKKLLQTPSERTSTVLNYVLARHSSAECKEFLENLLISKKYIQLALVGLSHIKDDKAIDILDEYADEKNALYINVDSYNATRIQKMFRTRALIARTFAAGTWIEFYKNNYAAGITENYEVKSCVYFIPTHETDGYGVWPTMPTLLTEFHNKNVVKKIMDIQVGCLNGLVNNAQKIPEQVYNIAYKRIADLMYQNKLRAWGVDVEITEEDLKYFSTIWIEDSMRYQEGSLLPTFALFGKTEERQFY
jgi:hypothetical protein